ncbi:TIGR03086 family metal-binding protein [Kitasatospora sp. NBC_00240]|uniref:TIGR03086 family metal-binding protein n=1 Tax=Kitasatospora sp. NBC_00240 TaxID=2903567 RepID=UPI002251C4FF|nr:TIGR03086 family metal-binding protein [Kitasatospora sp. NBC_00240]MCX5213848.1 TIGR03086 family metal-binding protein [Kitasatospora sp. NBC_00240]
MSERPEAPVLRLFPKALEAFGHHVRLITPHQWPAATPCSEWSVRDLVNHLTAEQLWVPELLMGSTVAEVGARFDGDVLDENPAAFWQNAAEAAEEAFRVPGAADVTVHLSFGDVPATSYCAQLIADAVVHTWDLARGLDADPGLSDELVDFALTEIDSWGDLATTGLFAPALPVPDGASTLTRLLALTGRGVGP